MKVFFTIAIFLSAINLYGQTVVIENDSIDIDFPVVWGSRYVKETHNQFGFFSFIQVDVTFNDFSTFKTALGEYNIDFMNRSYNHFVLSSDYWTVGLYGGYIFQFNEKPWVYSVDKRLINNNKIEFKNYSFGMRVSWNIE